MLFLQIMKILIFILAVTVLACSIIPCSEFSLNVAGGDQAQLIKSAPHQENNDSDNCSPFCSCNCCCGITLLFTTYQVSQPPLALTQIYNFHLPTKISDATLPVWQPPQLV